ncbi:MAG: transglutaminase family protein [Pirellulales bacterium]|nr:transglutaminase family protein [Pirellulales bacterium]
MSPTLEEFDRPPAVHCRPEAMRAWLRSLPEIGSPPGLFRAAWAIALHEMPEADLAAGEATIARLVSAVASRVRSRSIDAVLAHLHDVLFEVAGFAGNGDDYYAPANSYLPEVLRTRRGLPIALTLVYQRTAYGCGLVVHGVNAPGHFLAEAETGNGRTMYVDPFFGGGILSRDEALARVEQASGRSAADFPQPLARATPRRWLARMLANLHATLAMAGRDRDVLAMLELGAQLPPERPVRPNPPRELE